MFFRRNESWIAEGQTRAEQVTRSTVVPAVCIRNYVFSVTVCILTTDLALDFLIWEVRSANDGKASFL
jgi:hypothetical protein